MPSIPATLSLLLLLLPAGPALRAEHAVSFRDGRSMRVESIAIEAGQAVLTLRGGGAITVPASRIARWEELPAPAPAASKRPEARPGPAEPWRRAAGAYAEAIALAADRYDLDPALLTAMAHVESAFNPAAVSPKGASGLLQLMPATAERFGVEDVFDPRDNLDGGARYFRWLLERFEGRTDLALAGYNAGEGAVDRHRGIPPYRETRRYVSSVMDRAGRLGWR